MSSRHVYDKKCFATKTFSFLIARLIFCESGIRNSFFLQKTKVLFFLWPFIDNDFFNIVDRKWYMYIKQILQNTHNPSARTLRLRHWPGLNYEGIFVKLKSVNFDSVFHMRSPPSHQLDKLELPFHSLSIINQVKNEICV